MKTAEEIKEALLLNKEDYCLDTMSSDFELLLNSIKLDDVSMQNFKDLLDLSIMKGMQLGYNACEKAQAEEEKTHQL